MHKEDHGNPYDSLFGLKPSDKASVCVIPVTWDVTTSFQSGTSKAPEAILKVSDQTDAFRPEWKDFFAKILPIPSYWKKKNKDLRKKAQKVLKTLDKGQPLSMALKKAQEEINVYSQKLNQWVYYEAQKALNDGLMVGVLGGDHSSPLGLIQALSERESFGILHIDAHADLRESYCGFTHSHASIMYQVLKLPKPPEALVQVGIRDFSKTEFELTQTHPSITLMRDADIQYKKARGTPWYEICLSILKKLPQNVYISLDVDGLDLASSPNTGSPVPGGLSFQEWSYLLELMVSDPVHKKHIIGFDLCEVRPCESTQVNEIVGARLLLDLCGWCQKT